MNPTEGENNVENATENADEQNEEINEDEEVNEDEEEQEDAPEDAPEEDHDDDNLLTYLSKEPPSEILHTPLLSFLPSLVISNTDSAPLQVV